jgi:phosphoribosyl 1,2-cyclic phosphodiesterase
LNFSVLSSGSKANCLYLASESTRILVDCGLSAKQAALRLESLGIEPSSIDAIVITHEHSDHVSGVRVFSEKYQTKVYSNPLTCKYSKELQSVSPDKVCFFESGSEFCIGDVIFEPFSIMHDAADPVAFRVKVNKTILGIVTDLGHVTSLVRESIRGLDGIVIEANHDLAMLQECSYPWQVKQRIASRTGHLSNCTTASLLADLSKETENKLQVVIAAHISEQSNTPELAIETIRTSWDESSSARPDFFSASPYQVSPMIKL